MNNEISNIGTGNIIYFKDDMENVWLANGGVWNLRVPIEVSNHMDRDAEGEPMSVWFAETDNDSLLPEGTLVEQEVSFCGVSLAAIARDGSDVQTGHHSVGIIALVFTGPEINLKEFTSSPIQFGCIVTHAASLRNFSAKV